MITRLFTLVLAILITLGVPHQSLFAAPPVGGYQPGQTLDPDCAPNAVDCFVRTLNVLDEGVDTGTGNVLDLNFVGSGITATQSGNSILLTFAGGGSSALSSLTAGTADNTIDSANFAQAWNWSTLTTQNALALSANSLTSGNVLRIASSSTTTTTGSLLNVEASGSATGASSAVATIANTSSASTATGLRLIQNGTGFAFRVDDVTGDTSPFVIDADGNVGIGESAPAVKLDLGSAGNVRMNAGSLFLGNLLDPDIYGVMTGYNDTYIAGFNQVSQRYIFGTDSSSATGGIAIDSNNLNDSRVGIGTHNPRTQFDVAGATEPMLYGIVSLSASEGTFTAIQGNFVYVIDTTTGRFDIIDTSASNSMYVVSSTTINPGITSIVVKNKYAYIVDGGTGFFLVYDISNASAPVALGTVAIPVDSRAIAVEGRYAYITADNGELTVVDVLQPSSPIVVSSNIVGVSLPHLAVHGQYLYIVDNAANTFSVWSLASPSTPTLLSTTATASAPRYIDIQNEFAYVAMGSGSIDVYTVTNPLTPSLSGSVAVPEPLVVSVEGNRLYVIENSNDTIKIIDISDPVNPSILSSVAVTAPRHFVTEGGVAYISNTTNQLQVMNLGGAYLQHATTGSLVAEKISVRDNIQAQSLDLRGSLSVGAGGIFSSGALGVSSGASILGALAVGSAMADSSAILDLTSTTLGFLAPRMDTTERDAIATPATGLFVYNTDTNAFNYYNGTSWVGFGGASALSALTPATGTNTINNANFAQTWNWNTLGAQTGLTLATNSITMTGAVLSLASTGDDAGVTGDVLRIGVSGSSSEGVAMNLTNEGGGLTMRINDDGTYTDTTPFVIDAGGNVGIGTASPITQLHVPGLVPSTSLSSLTTDLNPSSVFIKNKNAFVVNMSSDTMQIIDISTSSPVIVSTTVVGSFPSSVYVVNQYAYVVSQGGNFQIFNISDLQNPSLVGEISGISVANDIVVDGDFAYIAIDGVSDSLKIFDISNPKVIVQKGEIVFAPGSGPEKIEIQENYVYVVAGDSGDLFIVDIRNSKNPSLVGTFSWGSATDPQDLEVQGRYVYAVVSTGILDIIDVFDPTSPVSIGTAPISFGASSLEIVGRYVYTSGVFPDGVEIFDVVDPTNPVLTNSFNLSSSGSELAIQGRFLYIISFNENLFKTFDLGGAYIQSLESGTIETTNILVKEKMHATHLTVNEGISVGLKGIYSSGKISAPSMQIYGEYPRYSVGAVPINSGRPYGIDIQNSYVYIVQDTDTLEIIDVTDTSNPVIMSNTSVGTTPLSVKVKGKYAYIINLNGDSLDVFDISNPASPVFTGTTSAPGNPDSLFVQGPYAYVTTQTGGTFEIYDIRDVVSPINLTLNSISVGVGEKKVFVQGSYAYIINSNTDLLYVFDISNPSLPSLISSTSISSFPVDLFVSGSFAYVVDSVSGTLQIFNISNHAAVVAVGSVAVSLGIRNIDVQGTYAYISDEDGYFHVVSVADPLNPKLLYSVDAGGSQLYSLVVQGKHLYVPSRLPSTLEVFDLGGAYIQSLEAGSAEVANLSVRNDIQAQSLDLRGGLTIGFGGILTDGSITVSGKANEISARFGGSIIPDANAILRLQDSNSVCDFNANAGAPTCGSDVTLKKDIESITGALDIVLGLRPATYHWTTEDTTAPLQHGFIAQEVGEKLPHLVTDGTWIDGTTRKFLNTSGMIPYLVGAVKELYAFVREHLVTRNLTVEETFCVGETCLTEAELKQIILQAGVASVPPASIPVGDVLPTQSPDSVPEQDSSDQSSLLDQPDAGGDPDPIEVELLPEPAPETIPEPVSEPVL